MSQPHDALRMLVLTKTNEIFSHKKVMWFHCKHPCVIDDGWKWKYSSSSLWEDFADTGEFQDTNGWAIGQFLERWQHQYLIANPIQSNGRVRDVFLAMERVWSKHSLVLQSFAQHRRLLGCHSGLHGWLQSNHRISLTLIFAEAVIETLFFFANFCQ